MLFHVHYVLIYHTVTSLTYVFVPLDFRPLILFLCASAHVRRQMLLKISLWSDGRRNPAAPVTGCYKSAYPPPALPEYPECETILLFLFPPLAAVGRACPAVLRVMLRLRGITGNSSLNLKLHRSERRERSSL
ncbi:hypothetical protein YE88_23040 [Salmonella enterica subsp. enterica serovar Schwarzengrund]|nr:hypothetical protein [Salmonella enterica subsp. enterica serovar Schwarzengrund]